MIGALAWLTGSKAGRIVAIVLVGCAALASALLAAYGRGKAAERAKSTTERLKALQTRMQVDDEVARLSPDDRRERLRRWVSDDG